MSISAEYDPEVDALYVHLSEQGRTRADEIDYSTVVDVASDGNATGIEFLNASDGVNLQEVVSRFGLESVAPEIAHAIVDSGISHAAPTLTGQIVVSTSIVHVTFEGLLSAPGSAVSSIETHGGVLIQA